MKEEGGSINLLVNVVFVEHDGTWALGHAARGCRRPVGGCREAIGGAIGGAVRCRLSHTSQHTTFSSLTCTE